MPPTRANGKIGYVEIPATPSSPPGVLFYIMVDNITATVDAVVANRGVIEGKSSP